MSRELEQKYLEEARLAVALKAELYTLADKRLFHYVEQAWPILEPRRPFTNNWHIGYLCEELEMMLAGEHQRLLINVPPRWLKSTICTICFPTWVWTKRPEKRFINASYSNTLSLKHSMDRRTLIHSPWYQAGFGDRYRLRDDQDTKTEFQNDKRGIMLATSVGGSVTGRGGDYLGVDDPVDPKRAQSELLRVNANNWFDTTFESRLDDQEEGGIYVVMQRLHDKDLTGHLLDRGDWRHVKIEAEASKKTIFVFPVSKEKKVLEEGELAFPQRASREHLDKLKISMGPQYGAQMLQDPRPIAGGFFPRSWWQRYRELPAKYDRKIIVVDCAQKPGVSNDWSVWSVILETKNAFYWKRVVRERVAFPSLLQRTLDLCAEESPDALVIEDKSAGTQLIQVLQAETTLPVEGFDPGRDDKVVRASAAQPTVKAGNCHLPERAEWVEDFLSEHEKFPTAEHDDQVDTTSSFVLWRRENSGEVPEPRVRRL